MPNMYESVGYETYGEGNEALFPNGASALTPPSNTVSRSWLPYEFENSIEGKVGLPTA